MKDLVGLLVKWRRKTEVPLWKEVQVTLRAKFILPLFVGSTNYVYLCPTRCKEKSRYLDKIVRSTLTKDTQCICRSFLQFVVILGFSHLCESGGSHISVSRLSSFLWSGSVNQKWHLVLSKACILSCFKKKCFAGATGKYAWLPLHKSRFTSNAHSLLNF